MNEFSSSNLKIFKKKDQKKKEKKWVNNSIKNMKKKSDKNSYIVFQPQKQSVSHWGAKFEIIVPVNELLLKSLKNREKEKYEKRFFLKKKWQKN